MTAPQQSAAGIDAAERAALVTACRQRLPLLSPREIEFVRDIAARDRALTNAQAAWLRSIAAREPIDFAAINKAALPVLETILRRWLPDGVKHGNEIVALNPTRSDGKAGSFRINLATGMWADFAVSRARGGDPISLAAYLFHGGNQTLAAIDLKRMLSL